MRTVIPSTKFRRDLKKTQSSASAQVLSTLRNVIRNLANDVPLAEQFRDHDLSGKWKGFRECHIRPDLLLVYQKEDGGDEEEGILHLTRLATHSELFG